MMIGDLIDHYRVLELIGRGAMGVVYKALDVNIDRAVAIKVMSAEARGDPNFVERFRQEARVQGALTHPNVALLFDYFVHEGAPVAVMEYIDGERLEQLIRRRGPIPAHESIPIFKQALCGVAAAHRAGIIHRDLKPANLMITKDGIVKVMDFGIAKRQGAPSATQVSTSIGSPFYMAPEQILGRPVDCRTDVYALGITLYELLAGQRPFNSRGKPEYLVLDAHVNELPEPPTVYRYGIPQPIVDAVMRSLAKEPDARFQSADEFMRALPDVGAPSAATPRVDPSRTVALEYSPSMSGDSAATRATSHTMAFEYTSSTGQVPGGSMAFDYSAATLRQEANPRRSTPSPVATAPPAVAADVVAARYHRTALVAALVATLVLGMLIRHALWPPEATTTEPPATPPPAPARLPAEPTEAKAAEATAASAIPPTATPLATTTTPQAAPPDLSGTWRGEYTDASGKRLLRVVSLSISRVHDDGGIDGTLQYEAASGDGECKLHPRGSSYSASDQRLQLSPEGCSPHYPKELGVPLDFNGVNPQANTLKDGRIEAPTGDVIRVKLKRMSGV